MTVPDWSVNYKNWRRDSCVLLPYYKCKVESGYFTFSLLFEMDGSSSYIPCDDFSPLYSGFVTQWYHHAPNSFPSCDIFQLHFLPGLMPFLNCFKVWVGDLTHSLKQYMWKSKQLIFMPKYCYTHCIKIATRYALLWQLTAGCVLARRVIC